MVTPFPASSVRTVVVVTQMTDRNPDDDLVTVAARVEPDVSFVLCCRASARGVRAGFTRGSRRCFAVPTVWPRSPSRRPCSSPPHVVVTTMTSDMARRPPADAIGGGRRHPPRHRTPRRPTDHDGAGATDPATPATGGPCRRRHRADRRPGDPDADAALRRGEPAAAALDPHMSANGYDQNWLAPVYERLIWQTPEVELVPGLATEWAVRRRPALRDDAARGRDVHRRHAVRRRRPSPPTSTGRRRHGSRPRGLPRQRRPRRGHRPHPRARSCSAGPTPRCRTSSRPVPG